MSGEFTSLAASDPYYILGVDPRAGHEEITAAYRRLARQNHPDLSRDPHAERKMAEINVAWSTLRDPERRAAFDRDRVRKNAITGPRTAAGVYDPYERETKRATPSGESSSSMLTFGRYEGWTLGEVARVDVEYLEWLARAPGGRIYRNEIMGILNQMGRVDGIARDPFSPAAPPRATIKSQEPTRLRSFGRRFRKSR